MTTLPPNPATEAAGPVEVSSPACYASEADDAYMGYLCRDKLVAELAGLLEAKRAGSDVADRLAADSSGPALKALAEVIRDDENGWCAMLISALQALGATPSDAVGGLHKQVMAAGADEDRFARFNRGQAAVADRLKTLLPKVRDDRLHADLQAMLAAHNYNIAQVDLTLVGLTPKAR